MEQALCFLCPPLRTIFLRGMMKVQLLKIAHARSGDKGDTANIGLIALKPKHYPILVREVTAERVKRPCPAAASAALDASDGGAR